MTPETSFGQLVRARRRALDLTQEELANRVGCAAITVRKIEATAMRPSQLVAERLAVALALPPDERAAFVRRARAVRVELTPDPPRTSPLAPHEVGSEDLSGRTIRGYRLGERIGAGSFGAVYHAVQPVVDRSVAVKIILPQYADHPDFVRRFEHEAQLVARLEHPHIVPLYDYWREPGVAYLVMRLLRGGSLHILLAGGALDLALALRLAGQIVAGLQVAHRAGVVHRDLKPANILLDEDANAYLADFGIAKDLTRGQEAETVVGAFVGSPAYSSPEQIRAEPVTAQTDVYALGVLLFELLTGGRPFQGASPAELIQQHLTHSIPPLASRRPGLPPALDAVIQRATAKVPSARYPDAAALLADLRAAAPEAGPRLAAPPSGARSAPSTVVLDLEDGDTPYKGLRAFGEADAGDFFGRAALQQQLLARLAEGSELARFLAVVGPSGSGKSSVVHAGLVPALRAGALPGSEQWYITDMVPGSDPYAALAAALWRLAPSGLEPADLAALLRADLHGLLRAARLILPADTPSELVLVIDQFEELFTLTQDEGVRAQLLDTLVVTALDERARVRVIVTLRADFLHRPLQYVDFGELLTRRSALVVPLTPDELEQAIVGPAARVGVALEPGLVSALVAEVEGEPGGLPLLQHALGELFRLREGRALTRAAHREIGGVAGALAGSAEACYAALDPADQALAQQLMLRLVAVGDGEGATRRRAPLGELVGLADEAAVQRVLVRFGERRLLSFDHDAATRAPTAEVAHEALLMAWPRLRGWLAGAHDDLVAQRRLAAAAAEWGRAGREPSYLAAGERLAQFAALAGSGAVALTADERAYVDASQAGAAHAAAAEEERQARELAHAEAAAAAQGRAAQRLRYLVAALAVFLAVAAVLSALALQQRGEAQASFIRAEAQRLASEANRIISERGNSEVAALLAIRSVALQYSPQGDAAVEGAATLALPRSLWRVSNGPLNTLALAPDGRRMVVGGQDGVAHVWDLARGAELLTLAGHAGEVSGVAFTPDGSQIMTASAGGTLALWDGATGQRVRSFVGSQGQLGGLAVAPDGRLLATSDEGGALLWDIATGQPVARLAQPAAVAVAWSADGQHLATGAADGAVRLWDVPSRRLLRTLAGHTGIVASVAFSPDSRRVVSASVDRTARIWDADSGAALQVLVGHTGYVLRAVFLPGGDRVATASWDRTARLWDAQTGQEIRRYAGHTGLVLDVDVAAEGSEILTTSYDGTVRAWDTDPAPPLARFAGHAGTVQSVALTPDGRVALTGGLDRTVRIWDVASRRELRALTLPGQQVTGIAALPDGRRFLTADSTAAYLYSIGDGQLLQTYAGPSVNSIAVSPDMALVALGGLAGGEASVRDLATGQERLRLRGHTNVVGSVAFSPDGRFLLTTSDDGSARLWDIQTGQTVRTFSGHTDRVWWGAVSHDGRYVVTGSFDKTARLWDTQSGAQIRVFVGHTAAVVGVAFSADDRLVVTGSADGTVRIWDTQTGAELRRLAGRDEIGVAGAVVFTPDGAEVLSGSADGSARLWYVDLRRTVDGLCGRLLRDLSAEERAQYGVSDSPTCLSPQPRP